MTDTPSQMERLANLEPTMTLQEVAETLADHGIAKATAKLVDDEGETQAAIAFFRGIDAQEYLDALDEVEAEGGISHLQDALAEAPLKDMRIRELEQALEDVASAYKALAGEHEAATKDNRDLRNEVASWRGR